MKPGRPLIVIGNGPSLRDLSPERFAGIDTIGMNAAYRDWERRDWWPTYYACADHRLALSHMDFFREAAADGRFRRMLLPATVLDEAPELAAYSHVEFIDQYLAYWFEQHGAAAGLTRCHSQFFESIEPSLVTTGAVSLRWGASLGYARIGLIGIDCRYVELPAWRAEPDSDLSLRMAATPAANPNYFFADYQREGDLFNVPQPSAHGSNLHLAAIAAVRDDFRAQRLDVTLTNLSEGSELFRQGTLPYQPLDIFLAETGIGLIVLDYRERWTLAAARAQLTALGDPALLPSAIVGQSTVSVLMLVPDEAEARETEALERQFEDDFHLAETFDGLRVVHCDGERTPRDAWASVAANRAGFALILDSHAVPLRFGWLDTLDALCRSYGSTVALGTHDEIGPPPLINLASNGDQPALPCEALVNLQDHGAETLEDVREAFPTAVLGLNAPWSDSHPFPVEADTWRRACDRLLVVEPMPVADLDDPWLFGPDHAGRSSIGLRLLSGAFQAEDEVAIKLGYAAIDGWLSIEMRAEDTSARLALSDPFEARGLGRHLFQEALPAAVGSLRIRIQLAEATPPDEFAARIRLDWIDIVCRRDGVAIGHARIERRRKGGGELARRIDTVLAQSRIFLPDGQSSFRHEITALTEDEQTEHCSVCYEDGDLVVALGARVATIASRHAEPDEASETRFAMAVTRLARTYASLHD